MSLVTRMIRIVGAFGAVVILAQPASAAGSSQTITFPPIGTQTVGVPLTLSATASSGLPVNFVSSPSNVCTVSGNSASFIAEGACFITASQAGDSAYLPAVSVQSFSVYPTNTTTKPSVTSKIAASAGKPQTLTVSVQVSSVTRVNGGNVFVSAEPFGTATTGVVTAGVATASIVLPANLPAGTFPITAVFLGTPQDFPSVGTTTFTVGGAAPPPPTFTVGGTVSGLPSGDSITLLDNGTGKLIVSANGQFTFSSTLASGAKYNVTVGSQPSGEVCGTTNGSGTISSVNITNVVVSCASTATTGSTAFSALSVGNARIAMVPLNLFDSATANYGVAPIAIDGTTLLTGSFVATSFPIQACSTDSANLTAICINYSSSKVAVLNFTKFVTTFNIADIGEAEYDTGVPQSTTAFSGAQCIICGVVAVPSLQSFAVSAFDGYHVYAYPGANTAENTTLTPSSVYPVPIAENFTLSNAKNWLISPDYEPTGGTRALRLIDLVAKKAYTWTTFTDNCNASETTACENFQATYVDAAAFDDTTKVLMLDDESGNAQLAVDLSQAVFNAASSTFSAPSAYSDYSGLQSQVGVEMSGILASSVGHWAFTVAEFGNAIVGVAQLPSTSGSGGSITVPPPDPIYLDLSSLVDYTPCSSALVGGRDPHAQGYTLSSAGVPLGLLVSGDSACVAVINFAALKKAPTLPSPSENVVDLNGYDPIKAGAIALYAVPSARTAASAATKAAPKAAKKPPAEIFGAPLNHR